MERKLRKSNTFLVVKDAIEAYSLIEAYSPARTVESLHRRRNDHSRAEPEKAAIGGEIFIQKDA